MTNNSCIFQDMTYYHNCCDGIDINSVGCELSEWEADEIAKSVENNSVILNTCAVTANIEKASVMVAKQLRKIYPDRKLYITGCAINYNKQLFRDLGATLLTNKEKNECKVSRKIKRNTRELAYVKVQEGCINHCAYCIVNKLRPTLISIPYSEIKKQIQEYLDDNRYDLQLIGTEICLYNSDKLMIDTLCERILNDFPSIRTLSLNALNPSSRRIEKLIDLMNKDTRMIKELYLSVQSGSDIVLERMHRPYTRDRIKDICNYNKSVKTYWDLVCGFPGETEEQFQSTLSLVKELNPEELMICPYSDRQGTESSKLPNHLSQEEIMRRANLLRFTANNSENILPKYEEFETLIDLYNDEEVAEFCRENKIYNSTIYAKFKGITDQFEVNSKMIAIRFNLRFNFINQTQEKIDDEDDFLDYYNGNRII